MHSLTSLSDVLRAVILSVSLNPGWHPGLFLSTVGVAASWRAHLCALTGKSLAFITRDVRLKRPQPLRLPCILYARGPNAACSCAAYGGEDQPLLVQCSVSRHSFQHNAQRLTVLFRLCTRCRESSSRESTRTCRSRTMLPFWVGAGKRPSSILAGDGEAAPSPPAGGVAWMASASCTPPRAS